MAELPETLLDDVEDYLGITWQDDKTDKKITGYIMRGMARLQQIAGASLEFTPEDQPRALLLDYCRYANSQAMEVFEKNFEAELLDLYLSTQAPVVDPLTVVIAANQTGTVFLVMPSVGDGWRYVYRVGESLTIPARMDVCAPPDFTPWDGNGIHAVSGQDVLVVEVNGDYGAGRAGKVTV